MRLLFTIIFIPVASFGYHTNAQSIIAISSGISKDLHNKRPFYMVPVSLRWEPFKRSAFFIEAIQVIGLNRLSSANAYTVNPQLPEHVVLTEAISPKSFLIGVGGAAVLYTNKKHSQFTLNISVGICSEHFKVTYRNYDKVNYEVLNPDLGKDISGLYGSLAGVYNFHKSLRDMFIMLRVQSASLVGPGDRYPLSYNGSAPLQLTFGYKLFYNKKIK